MKRVSSIIAVLLFCSIGGCGSYQPLMTPGVIAREGNCNDPRCEIRPGSLKVQGEGVDNDCEGEIDEAAVAPTERAVAGRYD